MINPAPPPQHKKHTILWIFLCLLGVFVVIGIIGAATSGSKSSGRKSPAVADSVASSPSAHSSARPGRQPNATPKHKAAMQTVTYIVTGDSARIQYGPAGSMLNGYVPMHITRPLGSPIYYSITAQLNGNGVVHCELLVNGKIISRETATGQYNIASCEIDHMMGSWENSNG
jgi:hypothetical protein